jgi:hypothetical protein
MSEHREQNSVTSNNVHYRMVLAAGLLCAGHGTTWAQSAADKAAADALFDEAKKLMGKGDDAAACEKFAASLSKVTQLGTQIALASCYEKVGKTASAWGAFRGAASAASKIHDKRQRFAEDHATALEARLSKLAIKLDAAHHVEGLTVRRDGAEVTAGELGSAAPVDPGEHTVEASAPGRVGWSTKVMIPASPEVVDVSVPALAEVPAFVPVPAPRVAPRPDRTLAYSLGGGGIAAIGASLIFGAVASARWNDSHAHCYDHTCTQTGIDLAGRARTMGDVATASFLVGVGAIAAGVILFLRPPSAGTEAAPSATPAAFHLVPGVGPTQVGLTLQGGF